MKKVSIGILDLVASVCLNSTRICRWFVELLVLLLLLVFIYILNIVSAAYLRLGFNLSILQYAQKERPRASSASSISVAGRQAQSSYGWEGRGDGGSPRWSALGGVRRWILSPTLTSSACSSTVSCQTTSANIGESISDSSWEAQRKGTYKGRVSVY